MFIKSSDSIFFVPLSCNSRPRLKFHLQHSCRLFITYILIPVCTLYLRSFTIRRLWMVYFKLSWRDYRVSPSDLQPNLRQQSRATVFRLRAKSLLDSSISLTIPSRRSVAISLHRWSNGISSYLRVIGTRGGRTA